MDDVGVMTRAGLRELDERRLRDSKRKATVEAKGARSRLKRQRVAGPSAPGYSSGVGLEL